jgi:hypothetical protein
MTKLEAEKEVADSMIAGCVHMARHHDQHHIAHAEWADGTGGGE